MGAKRGRASYQEIEKFLNERIKNTEEYPEMKEVNRMFKETLYKLRKYKTTIKNQAQRIDSDRYYQGR